MPRFVREGPVPAIPEFWERCWLKLGRTGPHGVMPFEGIGDDQGDREGDCMKETLSALAIAALVIWNAPIDHVIEQTRCRRDGRPAGRWMRS